MARTCLPLTRMLVTEGARLSTNLRRRLAPYLTASLLGDDSREVINWDHNRSS